MNDRNAKKIVIVGASTGLGRSLGIGLAQRGERVALLARRAEKVESAAFEAGNNAVAHRCDATDPEACRTAIDAAAEAMGGIDTVLYAAAVGPLVKMADASPDEWRSTFDTNVIGANNVTQAALPHLTESVGNMLYLSTTGASYNGPWMGLGVYQVTKAALNQLVGHWRLEHPGLNFTCLTIGECPGGEGDGQSHFNTSWDMDLAGEVAGDWFARGQMSGAFIDVEHLLDQVHALVTAGASLQVPSMVIIPRPALPD